MVLGEGDVSCGPGTPEVFNKHRALVYRNRYRKPYSGAIYVASTVIVRNPYRDTSLKRNNLPPEDHHRALGLVLL